MIFAVFVCLYTFYILKVLRVYVNLILLISALLLIHFMISFIKPKLCSFFYLSSFLLLVCPHSLRRDICNSFSSKSLISPKNFCIKKHLKMLLTASYRRTGTPLYKISCFIFLQFTGFFFLIFLSWTYVKSLKTFF